MIRSWVPARYVRTTRRSLTRSNPVGRATGLPISARSEWARTVPSSSAMTTYATSGSFMASLVRMFRVRSSFDGRALVAPAARRPQTVRPGLVLSAAGVCWGWRSRKAPTATTARTTREVIRKESLSFSGTRRRTFLRRPLLASSLSMLVLAPFGGLPRSEAPEQDINPRPNQANLRDELRQRRGERARETLGDGPLPAQRDGRQRRVAGAAASKLALDKAYPAHREAAEGRGGRSLDGRSNRRRPLPAPPSLVEHASHRDV